MFKELLKTDNVISLVAVLVGLTTSISVVFLVEADIFEGRPNFSVKIESHYYNETNHFEMFEITNIGDVQVQDAKIFVNSDDDLIIDETFCLEGFISENKNPTVQINFERMSSEIPCRINFLSSLDGNITKVTITGAEIPGRQFERLSTMEFPYSQKTLIYFGDEDTNLEIDVFDTDFFIIIFIVELFSIGPAVYFRQTRDRRIRKKLELEEIEMNDQWYKAKRKFNILCKTSEKKKDIDTKLKLAELEKEMVDVKRKLDEARSSLTIHRGLRLQKTWFKGDRKLFYSKKKLKILYANWQKLENQIIGLANDSDIDTTKFSDLTSIVKKLVQNNILSEDVAKSFYVSKKFRNELAHGILNVSGLDLEPSINDLKDLQRRIENI